MEGLMDKVSNFKKIYKNKELCNPKFRKMAY